MFSQQQCTENLSSNDRKTVDEAILLLGEHGDRDCVMELVRVASTHRDKWLRVACLEGLEKISVRTGDLRILIFAIQFLDHPRNEELLPWLIKIIGVFGKGPKCRDKIRPFLNDENPRVRSDTAESLDLLGEENMIDLLMPMLSDPNHRVKSTVAKILWKYGGGRMVGVLKDMLTSEDKWDRAAAAFALGEIGGFQVLDLLRIALKDPAPEVLRNAVKAFGKTGEKGVAAEIMAFLDHPDFEVKKNTIEALGKLEHEPALKPISDIAMLKHKEEMVETINKALVSICKANTSKAVGYLVMLLKNPNDSMRGLASNLLGTIGTRDVIHFLEKIVKDDPEERVREVAQKAIYTINSKDG
ncbi:MAG: hypothetical protein CVV64_10590 [Candidatus Wallbacteria bacterium HGW-Wallbacteria-1]|jgi:HEAT repeat protein|uniref:HEAT repeat domain-containing protein n=1 Tax=Candidatus Wallbacteria bacterium HGW-Wallbacteria-1 TaxID=2013854 RepID=A0A2N1PP94_9BACT|nr:MAG: hypothetical protein CVV64_10590 [Candidatus Wallbacteria bacterium HGW-Wallbacteria-1]